VQPDQNTGQAFDWRGHIFNRIRFPQLQGGFSEN
jgi:hypothetical protein